MSHEFVRVREQLLRPVKDLPIGFGRRVQKLKEKISEHVGEYLQSEQVMEEDITNAERDVRVKQAEIKEIERNYLSIYHWNLNSSSAHNFSKIAQLKAYNSICEHDFIVYLEHTYIRLHL